LRLNAKSLSGAFDRREESEMKPTRIKPRIVLVVCAALLPIVSSSCAQAGDKGRTEFETFYEQVSQAEAELFRGHPEPLKALWTRASDVTLFGVSGGRGEHGWDQVGPRLDWTNTQYSDGSLTTERLASYVNGDLGYVVQRENVRFTVPGNAEDSLLQIRATWIFRRERDGWRIIHRHADSQIDRQGPAERMKSPPSNN
jgi:ketosteroid isomerase-like protein